jgi:cytoskeletal protein CcmA (bactofilin family)
VKKLSLILISSFFVSMFVSTSVFATYISSSENLLITETIESDAYLLSGNGNVQADVLGDLYIAGGSINIEGNVHEDLVIAGGRVSITGNVLGDLRVVGGQVTIYGNVGDDVVIAGGQVDISKKSYITGSLVAGAGVLTVDGQVDGDLRGVLGLLVLNGSIGGDVNITVEDNISISPIASIRGDLNYAALFEADIPEEVINGKVNFKKFERESVAEDLTYVFFISKAYSFLAALLLALIFVMFAPNALVKSAKLSREHTFRSFGVGVLTMITMSVGSLILMLTVVGIPLAMIALAALLIILYIGKIYTAVWLSSYVFKFKKKVKRLHLFTAIGSALFVYYFISLIPFLGWVINLILFMIGVGSLVLLEIEYIKHLKSKKML